MVLIEMQTGIYLGEDNITRYDDASTWGEAACVASRRAAE